MLENFAEDSVREMPPVHSNVVESITIKPSGFSEIEFVFKFYLCSRVGVPLYFACHIIPIPVPSGSDPGSHPTGWHFVCNPTTDKKLKNVKTQNLTPTGIGICANEL